MGEETESAGWVRQTVFTLAAKAKINARALVTRNSYHCSPLLIFMVPFSGDLRRFRLH